MMDDLVTLPTPRDTQFAGFAKLLMQEMIAVRGYIDIGGYTGEDALSSASDYTEIIARRAYDLVRHTIECTSHIDLDRLTSDEHTLRIPDLTTWQEVSHG